MLSLSHALSKAPAALLHWWLDELGRFLPRRLTSLLRAHRKALILDVDERDIVLRAARPRGSRTLGKLAPGDRDHGLDALRRSRYRRWPLVVRLASHLGLRKTIDLPLVRDADLGSLLAFELDRLTPFRPQEVCFAWDVRKRDHDRRRMQVALELAPMNVVAPIIDLAADHGRTVDRMEIAHAGGAGVMNLLPRDDGTDKKSLFERVLPIIVLGLAVTAAWLPLRQQHLAIDRLDREIGALKVRAEKALAFKERIDTDHETSALLKRAKSERAGMTESLAELTKLIPDHSHVTKLHIDDRRIELGGLSGKASDLIPLLDWSPMFGSPAFRSAVTHDRRTGKQRFQLAVEREGGP